MAIISSALSRLVSRVITRQVVIGAAVTAVCGGVSAGLYTLHLTVERIENIVDPKVAYLHRQVQYIYLPKSVISGDIEENWEEISWEKRNEVFYVVDWLERRLKGLSWRLLEMISSADTLAEKIRTARLLTSLKQLEDSDFQQLAQLCDCSTAAILAREKDVDTRFFLSTPRRPESDDKNLLLDKFHDLFLQLKKTQHHWCLNYFISKVFRSCRLNYWLKDFEYLALECVVSPIQITNENTVELCVESLLHHVMIKNNVHAMVEARGLEVLMDACRLMPDSFDLKLLAAKVLMKVSCSPEYLRDVHVTGWLKVLVEWSKEADQRLSSPAASALSNLDRSSEIGTCYRSEVCLLHPLFRETRGAKVDVIIVHGLLGSAHSTWKQRLSQKATHSPLSRIVTNQVDDQETIQSHCVQSAALISDIPKFILEMEDEENLENEFEFILTDLPVSSSQDVSNETMTIPWEEARQKQAMEVGCCKSQCWPKDWLPTDCSPIRVLGVDYSSRITDWTNWCPYRYNEEKAQLSERAKVIMAQLMECGVGERPIVWIGHSMGGLIIKHMLVHASDLDTPEHEQLLLNTRSVFFLGTPHFGSPMASIRKYLAPLLPSVETKELELNCPQLLKLHQRFTKLVERFSASIVTFIETKGAKLTVLPLQWELSCVAPTPSDTGTGIVYEIPVGHVDIAKLSTRLSFIYVKILEGIQRAADESYSQHYEAPIELLSST